MVTNTWIIIIWLVVLTILKNMKDNGKDDIPYMKWKIKHVWNHQPVIQLCINDVVPGNIEESVWHTIYHRFFNGGDPRVAGLQELPIGKATPWIAKLVQVDSRATRICYRYYIYSLWVYKPTYKWGGTTKRMYSVSHQAAKSITAKGNLCHMCNHNTVIVDVTDVYTKINTHRS
jgi:hypothetical protein